MKEITEGDAASVAKPLPDNPLRLGPTAIAEIVEKRQFLQSPQWRHLGWLERTLWGWFSTREKAISEFAFPDGLSISHSWKRLARSSLILLLIAMFLGWLAPLLEPWALGFGIFITICRGLALVLNSGRAFHSAHSAAILMPCYAAYGLGFRELSSTLLKFSVIQYPMLIALTVACSAPVAWLGEVPMTMGLLFGLKAGLLLAGARLILLVFSFSSGTNDSSGFHVRSIFLLGVIVIGGILFLVLAGASLFVPGPGPAWLLLGMAQLDAYIFFRIYGWFYNATRIDLMSLSRQ